MIAVFASPRRSLLASLIAASFAQAGLAAVAAYCVQLVFDSLLASSPSRPLNEAAWIGVLFLASLLTAAGLETFRAWASEKLGLGYVAQVREALFTRIMNASSAALSQRGEGRLLLPFVGDLTAIKKWVGDGLPRLVSALATSMLLLCVLALRNQTLALAAGAVLLVAAAAVIWLSSPLSQAIAAMRSKRGAVATFVSSSIRAAQTVRAFDRFDREAQRLRRRSDALLAAGLRLARISGAMSAIVHVAAGLLVAATLFVGVIEVQRGTMSIGLVAGAISIAGLLAGAVRDLGLAFELWRRAKVSFSKVAAALAMQPAVKIEDAVRRLPKHGVGLRFSSVSVGDLFSRVSLSAGPGAIVNVVGTSGSGKSTLLALAARLRDPESGRVRINGRDLRRISLSSLRRRIGLASADTPLLRGTIAMNLRYRAPGASEEEAARVAEICNLAPIFTKFPDGAQARLSEGAPELSQSEAQRLMIARAMLDSPSVLILDDVDTRLDAETAARIARALANYPGTVLMVASAPALRRIANVVWRIRNKRVKAAPAKHIDVVASGGAEAG